MNPNLDSRLKGLFGDSNLVLVDIGASGGTQKRWGSVRPRLQVIGFEPDKREFPNLVGKDPKTRYLNTALFREKCTLQFNLARHQMLSSVFPPNRPVVDQFPNSSDFDVIETVEVDADTLDSQFEANGIRGADFLKLDTQGCELAILEGAVSTLRNHVFGLEVEVEFAELYKGQPLFADVDGFLRTRGFQLFDLAQVFWKRKAAPRIGNPRGQLIFADALYLREVGSFFKLLNELPTEAEQTSKLARALYVCVLHGYLDYAVELLDHVGGVLGESVRRDIRATILGETRLGDAVPDFRGRYRVSQWVKRLFGFLNPANRSWSVTERDIGNSD
ncbi:MAG: FkbM family methyltransferase [Candidatus Sumerlaeaceae bacterium]|nr:FkbM family methyltransferase [Candidatus Sumerlaeaceae bacterium]